MASVVTILPAGLPVPAAQGAVSAAVDVRAIGGNMTANLVASDGDVIAIDGSPDGVNLWAPFMVAQNNVTVRQPEATVVGFIRLRRARKDPTPGGGPTAPNLSIVGQPLPEGYSFGTVAVVVPAADGVGASVSVAALGITSEVTRSPTKAIVASTFDPGDQLTLEASADGNAPWVTVMQLQPLTITPIPGSFAFVRVRRARIPAAGPRVGVDGATCAFMGQGVSPPGIVSTDVKSFGATGDGVTDDSAAIQAAINAAGVGGHVIFPPGNYNCNATTLTTPNFITLEGPGFFLGTGTPAPTQIKWPGIGAGVGITAGININLKNLFLEGPATGIAVDVATHIQCWSVQFDNWATGIRLTNSFYPRFFDCEWHACAVGVSCTGVYNCDLFGCIFRVCPQAIVVADIIKHLLLSGGSIEGYAPAGAIVVGAASLVDLIGVYFESSAAGNLGVGVYINGDAATVNLIGNQVYLTEVDKWVRAGARDRVNLFARGNKFVAAVGSTTTPTAYDLPTNANGGIVDLSGDEWGSVAKVGSLYTSAFAAATKNFWINAPAEIGGNPATTQYVGKHIQTSGHFLSNAGNPGLAGGTGGGGVAPTRILGDDVSGLLQLVTGAAPVASGPVAIVTYNQTFSQQAIPIISPGNAAAAALATTQQVVVDSANNDGTQWRIVAGTVALTALTTYKWWYHVLGK